MSSFTGAEQADGLRCGGDRSENAEAPHEPNVLHGTVLLSHTTYDTGLEIEVRRGLLMFQKMFQRQSGKSFT